MRGRKVALFCEEALFGGVEFGHVLVWIFIEIGEAILAAKPHLLAVMRKDVRFVAERFVGDDALRERV